MSIIVFAPSASAAKTARSPSEKPPKLWMCGSGVPCVVATRGRQIFLPRSGERDVVAVRMDDHNRSCRVHLQKQVCCPVEIRKNGIGPDTVQEEDISRGIGSKNHAPFRDAAEFFYKTGRVPADHDITAPHKPHECRKIVAVNESCEKCSGVLVVLAGKSKRGKDLTVVRLPERKVHAVT